MAAMTSILTPYSVEGRKQLFTAPTHASDDVHFVQWRPAALNGNAQVNVSMLDIVRAAHNSDGDHLSQMIRFGFRISLPVHVSAANVNDSRDLFKEIVASDEFLDIVNTGVFAPPSS